MSKSIVDILFTALMLVILCLIAELGFKEHVDYINICILSGIIYITQKI